MTLCVFCTINLCIKNVFEVVVMIESLRKTFEKWAAPVAAVVMSLATFATASFFNTAAASNTDNIRTENKMVHVVEDRHVDTINKVILSGGDEMAVISAVTDGALEMSYMPFVKKILQDLGYSESIGEDGITESVRGVFLESLFEERLVTQLSADSPQKAILYGLDKGYAEHLLEAKKEFMLKPDQRLTISQAKELWDYIQERYEPAGKSLDAPVIKPLAPAPM